MLKDQDYKCKICGKPHDQLNKNMCIDHDHNTGKVRGLLCDSCNKGLGHFRDNVESLKNAIKYLKENV